MYKAISDLCTGLVPAEADILSVISLQSSSDGTATCRHDFSNLPEHAMMVDGPKPCIGPSEASITFIQLDYQVPRLACHNTPQSDVIPIELIVYRLCCARSSPIQVVDGELLGLLLRGSEEPHQACSPKRNVHHWREQPVEESEAYIYNKN